MREIGIKVGWYLRGRGSESKYPRGLVDLTEIVCIPLTEAEMLWRLKREDTEGYRNAKPDLAAVTPHCAMGKSSVRRIAKKIHYRCRTPIQMVDVDSPLTGAMKDEVERCRHIVGCVLSTGGDGFRLFIGITPLPRNYYQQKRCKEACEAFVRKEFGIVPDVGFNGVVNDLCYVSGDPDPYWAWGWDGFKWGSYKYERPPSVLGGSGGGSGYHAVNVNGTAEIDVTALAHAITLTPRETPVMITEHRHKALLALGHAMWTGRPSREAMIKAGYTFFEQHINRPPHKDEIENAVDWCRRCDPFPMMERITKGG